MSWQSEFIDAIKTTKDAEIFFDHPIAHSSYPLFIPKVFAKKIKKLGPDSILWKQFIPSKSEDLSDDIGLYDPIGDKTHSQSNQIIHRYQNRILFTPTSICPITCRYCFRKNELADKDTIFDPNFTETLNYLNEHPEVNEIIFSGGDPLVLSNEKIIFYLENFSKIHHVKYIRFHTRMPVILPSRIDTEFIEIIKKFQNTFSRINLMIHINHTDEIDLDVSVAVDRLIKNNIDLYSQTVLLKGINDQTLILKNLFLKLIDLKISPYYLHHPDLVKGAMNFYLTIEEGRKLIAPLHDELPGWAIPQYVIDIPNGEGKLGILNPESFKFSGQLINRKGNLINYPKT